MRNRSKSPPGSPASRGGSEIVSGPLRRPSDEEAVDAEWQRIESDRVAEEVAEARDDVLDADSPAPRQSVWLWGGFAAALLAGIVFAVAVNVALAARRPAPSPPPPPVETRPPSPNELGPGVGADEGEPAEPATEAAAGQPAHPTP